MKSLLLVLAAVAALAAANYHNHKVVRVTRISMEPLNQWVLDHVDVWGGDHHHLDMRVTPEQFHYLEKYGIAMTVLDANVQKSVDEEFKQMALHANRTDADWFTAYHTYSDIRAWYAKLSIDNPQKMKYVGVIGESHQARLLDAYIITDFSVTAPKQQVYFQGLIHAREWIAGATVQWITNELVTRNDADTLRILREFEIHVVPIMNPDGYHHTFQSGGRLWRKNRRANPGGSFGVDNNRNFDDHWGQGGSSTNPTSDTYMGPAPNSEPETQAVSKYLCTLPRLIAAIDYHSYSQLVLRPYGWTRTNSPDEGVLKAAGDLYRDRVRAVHNMVYTSQKSIDLYVTTGTASDWFYGDQIKQCLGHRTYAYTVELRPVGANPGFQLPPAQIVPTGQENYPAFLALLTYAKANPLSGN